jgi:hypothetical protein
MIKDLKEVADFLDQNDMMKEADKIKEVMVTLADQMSPKFDFSVVQKGPLPLPRIGLSKEELEQGYVAWADLWGEEGARWFIDSCKADPDVVSEIEYKYHVI